METKDTDGPVLALLVFDSANVLRRTAITNTKGYNKSLENGLLWALDPTTGKLLPLTDIDPDYSAALQNSGKSAGSRCVHVLHKLETTVKATLDLELPSLPALNSIVAGESIADLAQAPSIPQSARTQKEKLELAAFLFELEALIKSRKIEMPEGSYTTHLFKSGIGKIRKKTGEEAIELILAQNSDEIASEAADLLYHMFVLFAETGVSVEQVLVELKRK